MLKDNIGCCGIIRVNFGVLILAVEIWFLIAFWGYIQSSIGALES